MCKIISRSLITCGIALMAFLKVEGLSADDGRPELVLQIGHIESELGFFVSPSSMTFSPDGRLIVSSGDDTAIIWDATTGKRLRTLSGHTYTVPSATFSPDGHRIVTGSWDTTAIVWVVTTGEKLCILEGHTGCVHSASFSPDGQRIVSASGDNTSIIWDAATGKKLRTLAGHSDQVLSAVFSPDGRYVVTASSDHTAILWDVATGKKLRVLAGHNDGVNSVAFSPNVRRIVTASDDSTAIIWDTTTGKKIRTLASHTSRVESVSFSPDGRRIVTGSRDYTAIVWDAATGKNLRVLAGHTDILWTVSFSPNSRQIVTATSKKAIIWDADTGKKLRNLDKNSSARQVNSTAFSPDGRQVVTASSDHTAIMWDASTGKKLRTLSGHNDGVESVAFSPDGHRLVTASDDNTAIIWDATNGNKLRTLTGHTSGVNSASFSPDGRRIVTGSSDSTAIVWNSYTGKKLHTLTGHTLFVNSASYSHDGRRIITGSFDDTAIVWDAVTGKKIRTLGGNTNLISTASFSSNSQQIVTDSYEKSAIVWNAFTGKKIRTLVGHSKSVISASFSSDSVQIVTGSEDKSVIVWNAFTGNKLHTLVGHTGAVNSVSFSPDNKQILTGASDGTTRLWDATTGKELCSLISLDAGKDWLVVSPEGLFDGSPGGRQKVMYRVGNGLTVVPVDRFFKDFYRPGLLASIFKGDRPMPKTDFSRIVKNKPPILKIIGPKQGGEVDASSVKITVDVTDQGGGLQGPFVRLNGNKLKLASSVQQLGKLRRVTFHVPLTSAQNRIRIEAASKDGTWESEPARIQFTNIRKLPKPNLYVVAIGINKYKSENMNLKLARPDAEAIANLFEKRARQLYAKVEIHRLFDEKATAKNIKSLLTDEENGLASKVRPQDTLILFVAGHGFTIDQRFYLLPHEFEKKSPKFEDDIRKYGIPSDVLGDWISSVKATKRIVIMDTCNSGAAIKQLGRTRNPFEFDGAIERLGRAQGIFVIAATSATKDAREITELKHGLLTYSLLAGMNAVQTGPLVSRSVKPTDGKQVVSVTQWFDFAESTVPSLYKLYLGTAQDVKKYSYGTSFPVLPLGER